MKSSTSLIKRRQSKGSGVSTWTPTEFQPSTPEEADELHRLAEGITQKEVWLGYEVEAANAPPASRDIPGDDSLQEGEALMPEVIRALTAKRSSAQKSTIFKPKEIPAETYIWPTIEKQPEPSEDTDESLTDTEESAIDLEEIEQQAQEILERARQLADIDAQKVIATSQIQAEKTVDEARKSAESILQEAKNNEEAVTQQAYQSGMHTAHQEAVGLLAAARDVLNAAQAWHEKVLQNSEEEVLNLTRAIAQNLFGSGTIIDEQTLKQVFLKAMEDAKSLGNLRLHANPQDVEIIGEDWLDQQASLQGFSLEIIPSNGIQRGGCFIDGDFGTLDARVDKKLERVFEKIEDIKKTPAEENLDTKEGDSTEIISQAVQYASTEAPASPLEIQIAQPIDEAEIIDITQEAVPGDQIDFTQEAAPVDQIDMANEEGAGEQIDLTQEEMPGDQTNPNQEMGTT